MKPMQPPVPFEDFPCRDHVIRKVTYHDAQRNQLLIRSYEQAVRQQGWMTAKDSYNSTVCLYVFKPEDTIAVVAMRRKDAVDRYWEKRQ